MDIIELLKEEGLDIKVERGNRVFPVTDSAGSVVDALYRRLNKLGVNILTSACVTDVLVDLDVVTGVKYVLNGKEEILTADKVIIATGGMSYPGTGSTGDGYDFAKRLGHSVTALEPGLIPLECYEKDLCRLMQGVSLRNIAIKVFDKTKNKKIYEDFGELMFTHFGVTGPVIISSSSHLVRYKDADKLFKDGNIELVIDLKPALDKDKLDNRIIRDFEEFRNRRFRNSLDKLLPKRMIAPVLDICGIDPDKKVNEIKREERLHLR